MKESFPLQGRLTGLMSWQKTFAICTRRKERNKVILSWWRLVKRHNTQLGIQDDIELEIHMVPIHKVPEDR